MQTKTTNAVVAQISEFLLISSKADKNHFHLLVFDTITGKTNSILEYGQAPVSPEDLLVKFLDLIPVVRTYGFKSLEEFRDLYTELAEELSLSEAIEVYNEICEQSLFLLNVFGSHSRMNELQEVYS